MYVWSVHTNITVPNTTWSFGASWNMAMNISKIINYKYYYIGVIERVGMYPKTLTPVSVREKHRVHLY